MKFSQTSRNLYLALVLSATLTFALAFLYALFPLILEVLSLVWKGIASSGPQTGGIGAVGGGVSQWFVIALVIVAAMLFLIIFALLQKRRMKQ